MDAPTFGQPLIRTCQVAVVAAVALCAGGRLALAAPVSWWVVPGVVAGHDRWADATEVGAEVSLVRVLGQPGPLVGMGVVVGATSVHSYAEIEAVISFLDSRVPGEELPVFSAVLGIGPGWWYASGTHHAGLQTTLSWAILTLPLLPYVRLLGAAQQPAGFEAGAMLKVPIPLL